MITSFKNSQSQRFEVLSDVYTLKAVNLQDEIVSGYDKDIMNKKKWRRQSDQTLILSRELAIPILPRRTQIKLFARQIGMTIIALHIMIKAFGSPMLSIFLT